MKAWEFVDKVEQVVKNTKAKHPLGNGEVMNTARELAKEKGIFHGGGDDLVISMISSLLHSNGEGLTLKHVASILRAFDYFEEESRKRASDQ